MKNVKDILFYFELGFDPLLISAGSVITYVIFYALVGIALYVFRSIGLYVLAKRQKVKAPWLVFLPVVWLFIAAKLMGTIIIGGKAYKGFALLATIIFGLSEALSLSTFLICYFPLIGYFLSGGEIAVADEVIYSKLLEGMEYVPYVFSDGVIYVKKYIEYPYGNAHLTMRSIVGILGLIGEVLSLASIVFSVLIYIGLFRKFWPQHYVLATVLSVLGLFPIMAFVIRNKPAINFNDYIRSRYYGHGYHPYGGFGGGFNSENSTGGSQRPSEKNTPPNPFSEFDDDNGKDDNPFDM